MIAELERMVAVKPFTAGTRFTAADVYAHSHIGADLDLGTLPALAAFSDYLSSTQGVPRLSVPALWVPIEGGSVGTAL